jgi:hypothetical protein
VIVFIPCPAGGCKPGEYDSEWLPRQCPACQQVAIIGHGRRFRQAHDRLHDSIRVRRGLCNHCDRTLTVLPPWCVPRASYNLPARVQALTQVAAGAALEQAAPDCRDPNRVADPATIRRWLWRRIVSLGFAVWNLFQAPTLFAWDFRAAVCILMAEPEPP